jgi:hypothetical protein
VIFVKSFIRLFTPPLAIKTFQVVSQYVVVHGFNNIEGLRNSLTVSWETKQMLLNNERLAMLFNPHLFRLKGLLQDQATRRHGYFFVVSRRKHARIRSHAGAADSNR